MTATRTRVLTTVLDTVDNVAIAVAAAAADLTTYRSLGARPTETRAALTQVTTQLRRPLLDRPRLAPASYSYSYGLQAEPAPAPTAEQLANLADYTELPAGPRRSAIGCAGGRHRASGLTEILARELQNHGRRVEVEHLHVHLPRLLNAWPRRQIQ
ncbi:hypothetical protein ACIPYS_21565 [Kitasatospora sp. NPDC089913]|uniref:RapZ C-terminal domain-containing protein n=1 Tax=Kitasatospora sp. NPDC089913 TaxID=3364080 RepID=UPI00381299F9